MYGCLGWHRSSCSISLNETGQEIFHNCHCALAQLSVRGLIKMKEHPWIHVWQKSLAQAAVVAASKVRVCDLACHVGDRASQNKGEPEKEIK